MRKVAALSFDEVSRLLRADFDAGKLYWLPRPASMFSTAYAADSWNTRYAGKEAFTSTASDGYKQGAIYKRRYFAHRVIWMLKHGNWPENQIDHINGERSDNRLENLRDVTMLENSKNQKKSARNSSGATGVCWDKSRGKWIAHIRSNGRRKFLGHFSDFESAQNARKKAEAEYGFHPNHGRAA